MLRIFVGKIFTGLVLYNLSDCVGKSAYLKESQELAAETEWPSRTPWRNEVEPGETAKSRLPDQNHRTTDYTEGYTDYTEKTRTTDYTEGYTDYTEKKYYIMSGLLDLKGASDVRHCGCDE